MTGTPGRPLSTELSEQLLAVAVDILADEGWGRLNSDRVAARARAGKAGIYRRWATMSALARAAVGRFHLVVLPPEGGSVREDLLGLLTPRWTQPLSREERAVASLVGAARHDAELRAGLDEALVRPLAAAVEEICARAERRGEPVRVERVRLLSSVLEAFWWQRYRMPEPLTVDQVVLVVDEVLMPLVRPLAETVAA